MRNIHTSLSENLSLLGVFICIDEIVFQARGIDQRKPNLSLLSKKKIFFKEFGSQTGLCKYGWKFPQRKIHCLSVYKSKQKTFNDQCYLKNNVMMGWKRLWAWRLIWWGKDIYGHAEKPGNTAKKCFFAQIKWIIFLIF